jgi:Tfp pilus assembly protein PilF
MWLVRWLSRVARRVLPRVPVAAAAAGVAVAGVAALSPAWSQVASFGSTSADLMSSQQTADATDGADLAVLIAQVKAAGEGRAYAGTKANWGHQYTVGDRPVYLELENADADAIGLWLNTESLSSDVEAQFDETNPAEYDLFNIRYLILPQDHAPPVKADLLARSGRHTLWQVATSGYLGVVDTVAPPIVADRNNIGPLSAAFMASGALQHHQFPTVAFNGARAAAPTLVSAGPSTPAGTVNSQSASIAEGLFSGQVTTNRNAVVLLKSTFEPGWKVSVDGVDSQPIMVAPSFVGVNVAPGEHTVTFRFATYAWYPELLGLGLLTFVALVVMPRRFATRLFAAEGEPRAAASSTGVTAPRRGVAAASAGVAAASRRLAAAGEKMATATSTMWVTIPLLRRRLRPPRNARWMLIWIGLVALLALAVAGFINLVASKPDAVQATDYVSAGLTAQSQGRIDDAREDYRQALAHDPRNKFAYFNLGTLDQQAGHDGLAVADYEAALEADGNFVPALYNLAILITPSDPSTAVTLYQRAIQAQPDDASAHLNLGFLLHNLGRDAEAMLEFADAVRLDPTLASRIPAALRPPQS